MNEKSKELPLFAKSEERNDKASTIIVILESPDVSEYKNAMKSGSTAESARGRTGREILKHLVDRLKEEEDFSQWRIRLINPIQYSCSLGVLLSSRKKDEMFVSFFNGGFEECFRKRLIAACRNEQHAVINCCTKVGCCRIAEILKELKLRFLQMSHPSSWNYHYDPLECTINGCGKPQQFSAEILRGIVLPVNVSVNNT